MQPMNTTTNLTATNTMVVSRTWLATDIAGNTNSCCQTIVVNVGLPPSIATQPAGQTFNYGDAGKLSVSVTGPGPFTYQWRLNGVNIAGATGSTLNLSDMQFTNAGLYTVVISSSGGSVTSSVAVVNVFPKLIGQAIAGNKLLLTWAGPFILQSAPAINGPYTDVPNQTVPFTLKPVGPRQFFRLH